MVAILLPHKLRPTRSCATEAAGQTQTFDRRNLGEAPN